MYLKYNLFYIPITSAFPKQLKKKEVAVIKLNFYPHYILSINMLKAHNMKTIS